MERYTSKKIKIRMSSRKGLLRKNHSFLKQVYQIGKELNHQVEIESDAMIEVFSCMEKLMTRLMESACLFCKMGNTRSKKMKAHHIRTVSQNLLLLSSTPVKPERIVLGEVIMDEGTKKRMRILEIREELRELEKKEKRQQSLQRLSLYRKEVRGRVKKKEKLVERVLRPL